MTTANKAIHSARVSPAFQMNIYSLFYVPWIMDGLGYDLGRAHRLVSPSSPSFDTNECGLDAVTITINVTSSVTPLTREVAASILFCLDFVFIPSHNDLTHDTLREDARMTKQTSSGEPERVCVCVVS